MASHIKSIGGKYLYVSWCHFEPLFLINCLCMKRTHKKENTEWISEIIKHLHGIDRDTKWTLAKFKSVMWAKSCGLSCPLLCLLQGWTPVSSGRSSGSSGRRRLTACWGRRHSWQTRSVTVTARGSPSPALSVALTTSTTTCSKELCVDQTTWPCLLHVFTCPFMPP